MPVWVTCESCGWEQEHTGRNVACDECGARIERLSLHAAAFGCTGTHWYTRDAYTPFIGYDGPAQYAPVTCGWMPPTPKGAPMCTAADAITATEARGG